ncbi:MAG: signal peptide peptidase SppA, partial [Candidatus Aminicenantes bacterium]
AVVSLFFYELSRPPTVKTRSYLELNLSGPIQERAVPDVMMTMFAGIQPLSMHDIWMNIQKAKVDSRIRSLVLQIGYLQCDWAKANEIREAILDFRKTGKKAYVYIEEAPEFDKEYYLATACDRIVLHPLGFMGINGIGGYIPFFKRTLDKLGIEAEIEHVEEYKTAYNMFTENGFTPAHREMMESLYSDLYSHYVKAIAEARGKTEEEIRELIDHGTFQGEKALEAGLVDNLLYWDEFEDILQDNGRKLYKITHQQYTKIKPTSLGLFRGKKIAVIYGIGPIHTGEGAYQTMGGTTTARALRRVRKDRSIAAVVFRVDSPGGSAVGSDVIWREVYLTKREKPIVVSMSDVAGSGGYWVSMAADKIVAQPQSLTGSIGVISGKFNLARLYEKLGITAEKIAYGEKADIYSTHRGFTSEERELLKKEILWIYDKFLDKVADGRNMDKEEVDRIGKGRVWTGSQAKEHGLVDELGGLSRAIEVAKELADIPAEEGVGLVIWPKKISLWEVLMGRWFASTKTGLHPDLEKILSVFQMLGSEKNLALMPFWFTIE